MTIDTIASVLPNVVLVGFMGCGKSSVSRRLSIRTGYRMVDLDDEIVALEKRSISEIFAVDGEDYFRSIETQMLKGFCEGFGIILATGGGAILRAENRILLKQIGVVVWLDAEPDVLFARAMRSGRRPLLQTEDPRAAFDSLRQSRLSIYESLADFRIDSTHLGLDAVVAGILAGISRLSR